MGAKPALLNKPSHSLALPQFASKTHWTTAACIFAADLVTLSLVFGLGILGRHLVTPTYHLSSYFEIFPCLALLLCAFWIQGLYPGVLLHAAEEMRRIFFAITIVFLVMASTTFLWHNALAYSRSVFLITWAAGSPLVLLTRHILRRTLGEKPWWGVPALVLGSGPPAQRVVRTLRDGMLGVKVIGIVSDENALSWEEVLPPVLGDFSAASGIAASRFAQYAIIAMPQKSNVELRHVIQDYCHGFSHVLLVPDFPGLCSLGVSACEIGGEVGFELPQRLFHRSAAAIKRGLDLLLAGLVAIAISPLFLIICIAIKATSRGAVFYGQSRYGRKGEIFKALKFRSMAPDADALLAEYLAAHPEHLFEWQRDHKLKDDPRVTRVGKWLRRFSLDELPQILNVLVGQMSLVGPRPIVQAEIKKYGRGYDLYTRVRPGITGLWQVSGRSNTTYDERVALDEYYVRNWSIWLDAYILVRTVKVVITADGAY
ncbi:MAG TPA: undecaprenyl-phosphate galactose phosphotransferase WbaP [Bryobacteraceae bacterium]|nr:undecaprenyl-phosphate galactose phosphotransferase WbaP [Bryobacteraceae bacterium]HTF69742.1 undecaprenyl-phosphate galactose phosphotransferase WbaP [Edaphobacter sp.]